MYCFGVRAQGLSVYPNPNPKLSSSPRRKVTFDETVVAWDWEDVAASVGVSESVSESGARAGGRSGNGSGGGSGSVGYGYGYVCM